MGTSTRRSTRLAKKDGDSAPSTPSAAGGIKKRAASKVKKIVKAAVSPAKKATKKSNKQAAMQSSSSSSSPGSPDKFPEVDLKDHEGNAVSTKDIASESAFVVFLYPKANTPGCTTQACGFNDNFEELKGLGYRVFGLSYDSPKSQTNWKNKHKLPYSLLCDTVGKNSLIAQLGAHKNPKSVKRSHFFVAKGGSIIDKQVGIEGNDDAASDVEMKDATVEKPVVAADEMAVDEKLEKVQDAKNIPEDVETAKGETEKVEKTSHETPKETQVEMKPVDEVMPAVNAEETAKPADEIKPSEEVAKATDGSTKAEETAKPADPESKPEDAEMKPAEAEVKPDAPADSEVKPTDAEVKPDAPADSEVKPAEAEVKPDAPVDSEVKPAEAEENPAEALVKPAEADSEPVEGDTKPTEEAPKPMEEAAKPAEGEVKGADEVSKEAEAVEVPKVAEGGAEKAATMVTEAVVTEAAKDANIDSIQDAQVPADAAPIEGSTIPDAVETPTAALSAPTV